MGLALTSFSLLALASLCAIVSSRQPHRRRRCLF
jgi:hypothetical protein